MNTNNKQNIIQDLFDGLRLNLKLSEDICQVLEDEGEALKKMDTQALFRLSKQKTNLLAKIQYLDNSIQKTILEVQGEKTVHQKPQFDQTQSNTAKKLQGLANFLPEDKQETINTYQKKLAKLRLAIQSKNMVNKRFTEDTLEYLGGAISLLTNTPVQEKGTYGASGMPPSVKKTLPSVFSKEV